MPGINRSLFLFLSFFVFSSYSLLSQKNKVNNKANAYEQISSLKSGALLVRLQTKQPTIDAYNEKGYTEIAAELEKNQIAGNKRIIQAFNEDFHFCKVYFFLSEDSEAIEENRLDDVIFLNSNYEKDPSIELNEPFYLIAIFGGAGTLVDKDDDPYEAMVSFDALVIVDKKFEPLRKPFPYYVKLPSEIPNLKKLKKKIYSFDTGLRDFYYRQFKK